MSPTFRTFILALVFGAVLAPAAHASPQQISIMMDDDLLVYRDDTTAAKALTQMQSLGVDAVRVTVLWSSVAENAHFTKEEVASLKGAAKTVARRQNRRFRAANPRTYPIKNWDRYDNLVKAAQDRGIRVYFNVTGPGPAWAHAKPPKKFNSLRKAWKPKYRDYKQFVAAVGRRFSGSYRDENGSRGALPRVNFWSLWNEPNQAGWLAPQWEQRGSQRVPASPAIFRNLHRVGTEALIETTHGKDLILLGETAPLGADAPTEKAPMRPKLFLRELACLDANLNLYTGSAARVRECSKRIPLVAKGYAHHPYTKNVPPSVRDRSPDSITMANISELGALLDTMSARSGGMVPANLPLFLTEFGFETNPPDPFSGVPLASQAKFNTIGEYQAYTNPRVAAQSQFLLYDVGPRRQHRKTSKAFWFTYQSGLFYRRGLAKPAAYAYSIPFLAFPTGPDPATAAPTFNIWGQLRFLKNGVPNVAHIQWAPASNPVGWTTVGEPVAVDERGYFTAPRTAPQNVPGLWRAVWLRADGSVGQASQSSLGSADGT